MRRIGPVVVAAALFAAVGASPGVAQQSGPDAAARKLAADWMTTWMAHDADAWGALFDGPNGWFMLGGMAIASTDSVRALARVYMAERVSDQLAWETMHTTVLNENTVLFQGIYGGRIAFKSGEVREWKGNAVLTFLAERRGGAWRITAFHGSAGNGVLVQQ